MVVNMMCRNDPIPTFPSAWLLLFHHQATNTTLTNALSKTMIVALKSSTQLILHRSGLTANWRRKYPSPIDFRRRRSNARKRPIRV